LKKISVQEISVDDETIVPPAAPPPAGPPAGGSVTPANEPIVERTGEQKAAGKTATDQSGSKKANDPADKPQMEVDKLDLEIEALKYKRSFLGRAQDVIITVGPLAALFALLWTIHVGLLQQEQQRLDAASGRFERAYAKLGSQLPSERSSGVAQLSSLLHADGGSRDQEMLTALVNQLALDDNPAVSSGILNLFQHLDNKTGKAGLDSALQNVVHLQNVLVQSSGLTPFELSTTWRDERGRFLATPSYDPKGLRDPQPVSDFAQLSLENLFALKSALLSLLKAGATTQDMSGIFCPHCDFGQLGIAMSGVSFRNAILNETKWDGLRMEHSDFQDAILDRSTFEASNLQHANFNQEEHSQNRQLDVETRVYRYAVPTNRVTLGTMDGTPNFTCADLRDATFKNYPLLVRSSDAQPPDARGMRPIDSSFFYRGADIAGTDFATIREILLEPIELNSRANLPPYISMNLVSGPNGARYHYYATNESLEYLNFASLDKKLIESETGRGDVGAVAVALSETRNYEKAKLPPGVLPLIQANPASHRSTEEFCNRWRDSIKRHQGEHVASP
jgi:uncharacterized protein YjbI with pentapeptide repeats